MTRNGEYQGYLDTVESLRRALTHQLAEWYAGDRSDLRAGGVLAVAVALSHLRYGRSVSHEIDVVRKAAHLRNRRAGLPCSCGTIRACVRMSEPHETHLAAFLYPNGEEGGDEDDVSADYFEQ